MVTVLADAHANTCGTKRDGYRRRVAWPRYHRQAGRYGRSHQPHHAISHMGTLGTMPTIADREHGTRMATVLAHAHANARGTKRDGYRHRVA